jgi:hypothetical protein
MWDVSLIASRHLAWHRVYLLSIHPAKVFTSASRFVVGCCAL